MEQFTHSAKLRFEERTSITVPRPLIRKLRPTYTGPTNEFDSNVLSQKEYDYVVEWKRQRREAEREARRRQNRSMTHYVALPDCEEQTIEAGRLNDINEGRATVTPSEARILFRRAQAQWLQKEAERAQKREARKQNLPTQSMQDDCLRCRLTRMGTIFIAEHIVCSCKVDMPIGVTLIEEAEPHQTSLTKSDGRDEVQMLSVHHAVIPSPLASQTHQCEQPHKLVAEKTLKMKAAFPDTTAKNVVIYAPPGNGKTTLQREAFKTGVLIADMDISSASTSADVKEMLKVSSVLVNRPGVITEDMPLIAFIPERDTFLKRLKYKRGIRGKKACQWYDEMNFSHVRNRVECKIRRTFIADWFNLSELRTSATIYTSEYIRGICPKYKGKPENFRLDLLTNSVGPQTTAHSSAGQRDDHNSL